MPNPLADDLDRILTHTKDLWEETRGQRIFITGGTGFLGCWLLESFAWANDKLDLGADVLVLTRDVNLLKKKALHLTTRPSIHFHHGDVRSFEYPEGEFSHIIHAATATSAKLNDEDPLLMFDTIVEGTRRVLDFAVQCDAKKILLTSSGAVYGKQPPDITHIPEEYMGGPDTMDPRSAYAEGKRVSEFLCAVYSAKHGIECKIARCFSFTGPYSSLDIHYAIGNFIRDALNGGPIMVKGDGTPYRSYMYASDLAIWLWTILFRGKNCRPYNVGSNQAITISDLSSLVASQFCPSPAIEVDSGPTYSITRGRFVPSLQRVIANFCVPPTIDLEQAIRRTSDWHRNARIEFGDR